ncbi:MAG TPA: MBOAT family O-acyltransferase [Pseudomonadales bacterium]|nr:MBOAT family O-acyltransferase [Pseudomonadales bacterium]
MLFNTPQYIFLFLPLALLGFWLLACWASQQAASLWLALCSLFFYGYWDIHFVPLLLGSIAFNYSMGVAIAWARERGRSAPVLAVAVAANLLLLGIFKYTDFFLTVFNQLSGSRFPLLHMVLPLGISFFTFTQIAFLVDVHRGIAKEYSAIHYLLFVTYFPHLIAGPILYHKDMMPQFARAETFVPQPRWVTMGLFLFAVGLFKKVILADTIAPFADVVFEMARQGGPVLYLEAWQGALAYTLQLYFDFSGYVDMAIGASLMFGIALPVNFNSPYQAINFTDFWQRWHITLSRFFREYVYIPLGGNRKGVHRKQLNILVVMLLSGLWHGAGWTFIVWGLMHAFFVIANNYWRVFREKCLGHDLETSSLPGRIFSIALTFFCLVFCWVVFRADTLDAAWVIMRAMVSPDMSVFASSFEKYRVVTTWLAVMMAISGLFPNATQIARGTSRIGWQPNAFWGMATVVMLTASAFQMLYGENIIHAFLYFNF